MRLIVSRETGEILDVLEPASAADYAAFHQLLADQVRREILRIGREHLDGICRKAVWVNGKLNIRISSK